MILILSRQEDIHAKEVIKYLPGNSYLLLDLSQIPTELHIVVQYNPEFRALILDNHGHILNDLTQFKSFWWRRPQLYRLHDEIENSEYRNFSYNEIEETVMGIWQCSEGRWFNAPSKDDFASRKVYQLKVAKELGFDIPNTIITNSKDAFLKFRKEQMQEQIIYKPFHGSEKHWRETRILKQSDEQMIDSLKYAPVIFQDYIDAHVDIRVTVVDKKIFAAEIHSQSSKYKFDFRMDMKDVEVKEHNLPEEIEGLILKLMDQLQLRYGAIDMRLTHEGKYVFLEINPAGQWLFIEHITQQPISKSIAEYLIGDMNFDRDVSTEKWNFQM